MNPIIPIKNPRSAALVGLTMAASDEEFRAAWQKKFPAQGVDDDMIPPKLKILAGFKAEDDVTIDQIVTALEKKQQGLNQAKFKSLLDARAQKFPNEEYLDSFAAVANSDEGAELLTQMKRAETLANQSGFSGSSDSTSQRSSTDRYDPRLHEDAKQKFTDLTERLRLETGLGWDRAAAWQHASNTHPEGRRLYRIWKAQEDLKKKEDLARLHKSRSPHLY